MNDMGLSVVGQYSFTVNKTLRARGALLLETDEGLKRLIEYKGTMGRLEYLEKLHLYMRDRGFRCVDMVNRNNENEFISVDESGDKYIVEDWFNAIECDVKSKTNLCDAMTTLAVIHKMTGKMEIVRQTDGNDIENIIPPTYNVITEYEKHNAELRSAKKYIRKRKHKSEFEYDILKHIDEYVEYGENSINKLEAGGYRQLEENAIKKGSICHGNYNYHNVLFSKNKVATVNFDKSGAGMQIKDIYLFMRKVMEKNSWDIELGDAMLESYNKVRTLEKNELETLKIMLEYPEKYWKVVNHYLNGNKAWLPDKAKEKLETLYLQQFKKEVFVKHL